MTALCSGGESGPKAGVAETIIFTASALAEFLESKGMRWAVTIVPFLNVLAYSAVELCQDDPPADPDITAADALALVLLTDPVATAAAQTKLIAKIKRIIWFEFCECKTVATPSLDPIVYAPPEGLHTEPALLAGPCWSQSIEVTVPYGNPAVAPLSSASIMNQRLMPAAGTQSVTQSGVGTHLASKLPGGARWQGVKLKLQRLSGTPYEMFFNVSAFDAGGSLVVTESCWFSSDPFTNNPGEYDEVFRTLPASVNSLLLYAYDATQPPLPALARLTIEADCGQTSTATPLQTCAPDPAVRAMLDRILQLVTIIQRQAVPFAYLPGATHTPLSGTGELNVQGLVAVSVVLETVPPHLGMAEGAPDRIFDAGFIAVGTTDGWQPATRVTSSPFYLRVGGEITKIGYSFAPGVVASIAEHVREP